MSEENKKWIPEILYEEGDGSFTSHIPFVHVPENEEMPRMLFVFESRDTGEFEPGPEGEDLPVTEIDLHQYANMNYLKENLSSIEYDNVRFALGLEALRTAAVKGHNITANVRVALNNEDDNDRLNNS